MNGKILLGMIVLIAVGVLLLPSTVSLFAGQHYWYNLENDTNDVPCQKCHADVYEELKNSEYHWKNWGQQNAVDEQDCMECHQVAPKNVRGITFANGSANVGSGWQAGKEAHAAATVSCMWCHGTDSSGAPLYPNAPIAGGFNLTNYTGDTGIYAAHKDWVNSAKADTSANGTNLLLESNEACIGCHTHVAVRINWTHASSLEFNATNTGSGWTTENYRANGTAVRIVWGNAEGTGGFVNNGTTTIPWGNGQW
ncbi:hypothetical protein [Geoglobus acetivorans]|uniref:Cytochrome c family protein n=1 Tax=Geoglobus acetivorans TaxID=565033 RepID=A0ABZ3H5U1_GEOAI|nr:hypothetical protein [Geoglobus acetivorans]